MYVLSELQDLFCRPKRTLPWGLCHVLVQTSSKSKPALLTDGVVRALLGYFPWNWLYKALNQSLCFKGYHNLLPPTGWSTIFNTAIQQHYAILQAILLKQEKDSLLEAMDYNTS